MENQIQIITKDVKRDVLVFIVLKLKHGQMSKLRAKILAKEVVGACRELDAQNLFKNLFAITKEYPEINDIYIKNAKSFDKAYVEENLNRISSELKVREGGVN